MPNKRPSVKNEKQYEALGLVQPRWQELLAQQLVAGWYDGAEESGGPQGRPRGCTHVVTHH